MMEDIHYFYHLPIHGKRIHHAMDWDLVCLDITVIYDVDIVDRVLGDIFLGGLLYFQY